MLTLQTRVLTSTSIWKDTQTKPKFKWNSRENELFYFFKNFSFLTNRKSLYKRRPCTQEGKGDVQTFENCKPQTWTSTNINFFPGLKQTWKNFTSQKKVFWKKILDFDFWKMKKFFLRSHNFFSNLWFSRSKKFFFHLTDKQKNRFFFRLFVSRTNFVFFVWVNVFVTWCKLLLMDIGANFLTFLSLSKIYFFFKHYFAM